jgi:ABC-type multidrug transport system ATPase subunit
MSAVELVEVSKSYGLLPALKGISLTVDEGEAVAFLGPNGAGKSTLLRIVASQIRPTLSGWWGSWATRVSSTMS